MNSHQRRKDRRHWKHSVMTGFMSFAEYIERWDWCYNKIGCRVNSNWREKHRTVGTHWEFVYEKDAVLFALRWA
jgi:hypothetical protein